MKFLETDNVCVKRRRSKLLLDLYELLHQTRGSNGKATLSQWNEVRGHDNWDAARQDLTRHRALLKDFGVNLRFGHNAENVFVLDMSSPGLRALVTSEIGEATRFIAERGRGAVRERAVSIFVRVASDAFRAAIANSFAPDPSRGLHSIDDAVALHEESTRMALEARALSHSDDTNESDVCLACNAAMRIPLEDLVQKRASDTEFAPMSELKAEFHIGHARLRRILKVKGLMRPSGRPRAESRRSVEDVEAASLIARGSEPFKVKVGKIESLLQCKSRTAVAFIRRVRGGKVSSNGR